ncbi:MAG TPA: hypothetical protein VFV81_04490, partial [Verrucomicrobiae bacterium]|nr:hypothetical protein [Verrucomicrobiae bacterium]
MQSDLSSSTRRLLFFFFFISGFCSLLYQVVWTRLAFAAFGIITPVLSVVLSVFMLGLGVGSWLGGRWAAPLGRASRLSTGVFYGLTELVIGLGAYAVPKLFAVGEKILLSAGQSNSIHYLFFSAVVLAISILPWCLFMGATFPLAMAFLREQPRQDSESFSYLYLANVLGAMSGAILTAVVFVEAFGFHQTLHLAAIANFSVAAAAIFLGLRQGPAAAAAGPAPTALVRGGEAGLAKWVLFSTGFCAMAMEVAWTRAFT